MSAAWHNARRILCIRLDSLGDVLMCTPALRALRAYEARTTDSAPAPAGSLTGYVSAANSTEPIGGATVTVAELPGLSVLTNGEGYYVIPGLPATYTTDPRPMLLVLKSGTVGGPDFLETAIAHLRRYT